MGQGRNMAEQYSNDAPLNALPEPVLICRLCSRRKLVDL